MYRQQEGTQMQDLIEMVRDLEQLGDLEGTPGFWHFYEDVLPKWEERLAEVETAMEKQHELSFS